MYHSMMIDVNLREIEDNVLIDELENRGYSVTDDEEEEDLTDLEIQAQKLWALIRNGSPWEAEAREFIFTLANKVV